MSLRWKQNNNLDGGYREKIIFSRRHAFELDLTNISVFPSLKESAHQTLVSGDISQQKEDPTPEPTIKLYLRRVEFSLLDRRHLHKDGD